MPFDPSGTSGSTNRLEPDGCASDGSVSRNGTLPSRETDVTSLTSDFSSMSVGTENGPSRGIASPKHSQTSPISYIVGTDGSVSLANAKLDDKVVHLAEMFPSIDTFTIQHTLKKCGEDVERCMDILLNFTFLREMQPGKDDDAVDITIPKGIDGFEQGSDEDNALKQRRKRKKKSRSGKNRAMPSHFSIPTENDTSGNSNRWDMGRRDVDFICSRVAPHLKRETIASVYHANGASLSAAIRSLADANAPLEESQIGDDPVLAANVAELVQEFPSVPLTSLAGLLKVTNNSVSATNDLATALTKRPPPTPVSEIIKIAAPPIGPLDDDDDNNETSKRGAAGARGNYNQMRSTLGSHFLASADAFSKANAAYRRGRSDRLMGGAAAYYSAVGRDRLERAKEESSVAADMLVDSQSTPNMLDLHGVSAQDAVRIASSKVAEWWEMQGDAKYIRGGNNTTRQGYEIVTGVGRHSQNGTSRLGPAVGKMLAREGWKFEVREGVLIVVGVVRRR